MMSLLDNKLTRSLERRGFFGTVGHVRDILDDRFRTFMPWDWDLFVERKFDRNYDVDTAGHDDLSELKSHFQYAHAERYEATRSYTFRRMHHELNIADSSYSSYVFVDLGCGKGKVLLLAAGIPFKRVIGLELSPRLAEIAETNIRKYRGAKKCPTIELHCIDAAEYRFPVEPAVLFFFNPFKESVMQTVIERIRHSIEEHPRQIFILYKFPKLRYLMDAADFLVPVTHTMSFSIYKNHTFVKSRVLANLTVEGNTNGIPADGERSSEHGDAGTTIVPEVFAFVKKDHVRSAAEGERR